MVDKDPGDRLNWSPLDWLTRIPVMLPPEPSYKEIKLLGTKLDTKNDIARKNKVWQPIQKFSNFFRSKRLSVSHKIRIFRAYVETTLLYNSETWALTPTLENSLDQFHRRLLRIAVNIRYPKKISSVNLYNPTKETPISVKIKKRRLALFGHILRLHPDTPAQQALQNYTTPTNAVLEDPTPLGSPSSQNISHRHSYITTSKHQ